MDGWSKQTTRPARFTVLETIERRFGDHEEIVFRVVRNQSFALTVFARDVIVVELLDARTKRAIDILRRLVQNWKLARKSERDQGEWQQAAHSLIIVPSGHRSSRARLPRNRYDHLQRQARESRSALSLCWSRVLFVSTRRAP